MQHQLPDCHTICSRQVTATPPLSHLSHPGNIPWLRGQWWLGEGVVQCAWQNGETDLALQASICQPGFHLVRGSNCATGEGGRHGLRGDVTSLIALSPAHSYCCGRSATAAATYTFPAPGAGNAVVFAASEPSSSPSLLLHHLEHS
jgi:hypothetical protein